MPKSNSLKTINSRYHKAMKALAKGEHEKAILASLSNGKNTYLRMDRLETSSFDSSWIEKIEAVIFDLGDIIANPRQNTKTEGNLVPVELARKTTAESVQHLASHTQFVKEIDEYGNVIPSKILSMVHEDDIKTYENRFIATFVRRLVLFIEKRYEFVSKFAELHDEEVLYVKNKSVVDGATVEIETKIKISSKNEDDYAIKSNRYVERIKQIRDYILYFYNSPFMKKLKTEKDVRNPILQTNIIRKNPKYHHCFEVYKFIEGYDHLGVNYKVDENYTLFNAEEMQEINRTLFASYITLKGKEKGKNSKNFTKVYKPKILTSLDDESFIYGPLLSGPISFVRVDGGYQEYLDSKIKKDLPLHPTKKEKEYYADEYAEKSENKEDLKQKNNLLKRTEKSVKEFDKAANKIVEEREEARLDLLRREKEVIQKEEAGMLDDAREALIAASLQDRLDHEEEQEKKEKEFLASIKPAKQPTKMSHPKQKPVTFDEAVKQIWPQIKDQPLPRREESKPAPVEEEIKEAVVPTKMSHPASKPVTFEEAVNEIWPQLRHKPKKASIKKENKEPTKQEAPKEEVIKPAIVPTPMSHPAQKPVTYDEAVAEIWPQINNKPEQKKESKAASKAKVKEPAKEEKAEDIKPAIVPVEMSHPAQKPVTYDEAVNEIWPQINKPAAKPKEAKPGKEKAKPVVKENTDDIKPAKVPVEMSHPHQDPLTYEQAVEQIWPQINKPAPVSKPVEDKPQQEKAPKVAKPKANKPAKVEEKQVEAKPQEAKPEPKPVEAKPKKVKPQPAKPQESKPKEEKPQPVVKENKEAKAKPVKKQEEPAAPFRKKSPGRFIVKTNKGYYVKENKYSIYKEDAKIFDDYNLANDIKKAQGGKVVKF